MGVGRLCWNFFFFFFVLLLHLLMVVDLSIASPSNSTAEAAKHSDRRGKALKISKKPCTDPNGEKGVCTFKWDCINNNGTLMGTCVDGFIFGTCCRYNNSSNKDPPPPLSFQETDGISNDYKTPPPPLPQNTSPTTATRRPVHVISLTTPKPSVTPTTASVIRTSSTGHQLVTWTSIGPTKAPQRPSLVLRPFPFRPGSHFPTLMQGGGWPMGVAFPVDPLQINRPLLQMFGPPTSVQGTTTTTTVFTQVPSNNGSHTVLGGSDNATTQVVDMTTVSVPIPQWTTTEESTTTTDDILLLRPPQQQQSSSSTHRWNSTTSTGTPLRVTTPLDYRKDCGVRAIGAKARIVGGQSASFGRWPWQVLVKEAAWLGLYQKNKCGGVLVSSKYAITAGHCQPGRFLSALVVILGEYDLLSDDRMMKPEVRRVKRMIVHRHYNPQNFDNDIALLELDPPVHFRPHISPVCLPQPDEDFTGRKAYVTGWGKTSHGGIIPNLLQEVSVPIVSNAECLDMFRVAGHAKLIKDTFLCAGYKSGGKDSCEGDSGGPLMVERESGQWVLVGTVSHGIRCADPNLPGVYMRISAYRSWIDKILVQ